MLAYRHVCQIKHRLALLHARHADAAEMIERGQRLKAEVAVEIEAVELELASAVAAPVEGTTDPTRWLPTELMILILLHMVSLGGCRFVCKTWNKLCRDRQVKAAVGQSRWRAYASGTLAPRRLIGHMWAPSLSTAKAVGNGGRVYGIYGSQFSTWWELTTVKVWSASTGDLLQTLQGHTSSVNVIAVGDDGTVYSGSNDGTVKVWSGEDGRVVRTLIGHDSAVTSLSVNKTHVYSGSVDSTIRVWSCPTGECVQILSGHQDSVRALVLDNRGKLYSGSVDKTIRVWSLPEHTHLRTMTGHTDSVSALVVSWDGTLFSGSWDHSIRMWSADDGTLLRTLRGHKQIINSLAFARDGALLSGGHDGLWIWRTDDWTGQVLEHGGDVVRALAVGAGGEVYSSSDENVLLWT